MMSFEGVSGSDKNREAARSGNAETSYGDWMSFLRQAIQRAGVDPANLKNMDWKSLEGAIGQRPGAFNPGGYTAQDLRVNPAVISMLAQRAGGTPQQFLDLPPQMQRSELGVPGYSGVS